MHGFIEPESVNGTDYESGDSSVDETENGPSARSLLANEGTENETLEVLGAVRRVKEKRKSSPKLDEGKADSKPTEFQLVETSEKESRISLEQSKEVSEKDSAFTAPPLELRTVLLARKSLINSRSRDGPLPPRRHSRSNTRGRVFMESWKSTKVSKVTRR